MEIHRPDDTDIRIMRLLQQDARLTGDEIGRKIHKATASVNRRIRILQNDGYIKKYVAILDNKKLNLGFITFTRVKLKNHSNESMETFEDKVSAFPEVLECHHLTGKYDFILRIAVADADSYAQFLTKKLFPLVVKEKVFTELVLRSPKMETGIPLAIPGHPVSGSEK